MGGKGRGSNLRAILVAGIPVSVVIGPHETAPAMKLAKESGVRVVALDPRTPDFASELLRELKGCKLLCLAGYLRLLPREVIQSFPGQILNIHPALLPKFGGPGMYGHHVHEAVHAAGERESGCTVHAVTEHYDEGPILGQLRCEISAADSAESIASKVLKLEHRLYPQVIREVLVSLE